MNALESHAKSQKQQRIREADEVANFFTKTGTKQSTSLAPFESEGLNKQVP